MIWITKLSSTKLHCDYLPEVHQHFHLLIHSRACSGVFLLSWTAAGRTRWPSKLPSNPNYAMISWSLVLYWKDWLFSFLHDYCFTWQGIIWWQHSCSELSHFGKQMNRENAILNHLQQIIYSSEHQEQEHLLLQKLILQNQITGFVLCLLWMIIKIIISFFYTKNQLHWNDLMFKLSLQHCFEDCEGNIKLISKPPAHQHSISFSLISSHIGKLYSSLSE